MLKKTHCLFTFQGLQNIFDKNMRDHWDALYEMTDKYTDGWLSSGIMPLLLLLDFVDHLL